MSQYALLICRSQTEAVGLRRHLGQMGVLGEVVRPPRHARTDSCGWAVRVGAQQSEEALRRLAAQLPQKEKIALCDVVLYNNADEEALRNEVLSCVKRAGERNDENGGQL